MRTLPQELSSLLTVYRRTICGSKKEETLRRPTEAPEKTRKSECCPTGRQRTGSSSAHSGESRTETDVDTGGSSCTKRPLSPQSIPVLRRSVMVSLHVVCLCKNTIRMCNKKCIFGTLMIVWQESPIYG